MSSPESPGGGNAELRRFRRLVEIAILNVFVLIVVGGIVRVSESGLGCGASGSGTEGWPLCGGQVLPGLSETHEAVEFSHRLLASVLIVLIGLMVWRARRDLRDLGWPLRGSLIAGGLVLFQAALGGLTVENNLDEELVAAHLCLAMLLLGVLLWIEVNVRRHLLSFASGGAGSGRGRPGNPGRSLTWLATGSVVLLLAAIVAGGYIAGTEKEGADGPVIVNGAHLACGEQFPKCLNQAFPFGESRLVDIHLTHRVLVYLATAAIVALLLVALANGIRSWLLAAAAGLLGGQLLLGALNVWLGKHATLVVLHLTTATLLWSAVLLIGLRFAWATAPARSPTRGGQTETSPVAA